LKKNLDFYQAAAKEKAKQIEQAKKSQASAIYNGKK